MPELLESVAVIAGTEEKWECPYSHDSNQDDYTNDFVGSGGTLGERLEAGQPTSKNPQYGGNAKLSEQKDPRHDPGHELNKAFNPLPINLVWNESLRPWPVTCAAHHLIPSGDALAKSALLPWLIKKGTTAEAGTKGGTVKPVQGKVANNVGYDVNGAQNGVWLPGPYAMRGIWTTFTSEVDPEDDVPSAGSVPVPDGPAETMSSQLEYAVVAMKKAKAQFHDSHRRPYSAFVLDALNLVASKMSVITDTSGCQQCSDKIKKHGPPAPYSLIQRLDDISKRLRHRLEGGPAFWKANLWTSKWALEYMRNPSYKPPNNP